MHTGGKKEVSIKAAVLETIGSAKQLAKDLLPGRTLRHLEISVSMSDKRYSVRAYVNSSVARLHKNGLVEFKKHNSRTFLALTPLGREELARYSLRKLKIKEPWRWDGKWRLISFDIKESRRYVRDDLRRKLRLLGFVRLHNSMWIYPYECREVVILLKAGYKLGKDLLYITADELENEKVLRSHFNL